MKKLCFVATTPSALHSFQRENIRIAGEKWLINIVSNPHGSELLSNLNAHFIPLAFERNPSPWRDFCCLLQLIILFRQKRYDLVQSITPKAGLLTMLASWIVRVPVRIHTFTGQVWVAKQGWKRSALKIFDKLIVLFATNILVDSPSQRDFLVSEGVLLQSNSVVIGHGSICGVDSNRFHPDAHVRALVREDLGIGLNQKVILFLGRLNRDKGILDLAEAFTRIASKDSNVVLLLVGPEEDVSFLEIQEICVRQRERLHWVGFTPEPERYMAVSDIFCLPSYREGFGQVIIEAGASGLPVVASRIYGITDAVEDGKTGLLFPPRDIFELTHNLLTLIEDNKLCKKMGDAARIRAQSLFSNQKIADETLALYGELLINAVDK